jgi:hypothetical protein
MPPFRPFANAVRRSQEGGLRAFPICLDVAASAAKQTFADRRRGSHQNGCIRANKFRFAFSLRASMRADLASPTIPDKVNEPIAAAAQSADGGFHH